LWTLWFRSGNSEAQERLHQGTLLLDAQQPDEAIDCFSDAIRLDPTFSEAFNQRAIAHYLLEDFPATMDDCELAVRLMPCHFGAWAGLGHCHAHLANHEKASRCYRRALSINPYLHGVRQMLQELRLGCCQLRPPKVRR
jgi:tetratricopeptide (TPR) repeat protein